MVWSKTISEIVLNDAEKVQQNFV